MLEGSQVASPVFTVVIPTYNRAQLLLRAIGSVLDQTFGDFELIVVDDGSTDDTRAVVERFGDPRIRYLYQDHRGVSAARNAGAALAEGQYLAFLDSDDAVLPDWLKEFAAAIDGEGVGVVCVGCLEMPKKRTIVPRDMGPTFANQTALFLAGTFAVRRDVFEIAGGYAEELMQGENNELGLRLVWSCAESGWRIASQPNPLVIYHKEELLGEEARTRNHYRLQTALYLLEKHKDRLIQSPAGISKWLGIAGVNAARLGKLSEARRFFCAAIRNRPTDWKQYARLGVTFFPLLARKLWLNAARWG